MLKEPLSDMFSLLNIEFAAVSRACLFVTGTQDQHCKESYNKNNSKFFHTGYCINSTTKITISPYIQSMCQKLN
jgi:hypothetical protein